MRAAVAECLLSLVTRRAHAATIAGDLLEGSRGSTPGFWLDLLSATGGLLATAVRRAPLRTLWLAALGLVMWSAAYTSIRAVAAGARIMPFNTSAADCCTAPPVTLAYFAAALIFSNGFAGFWLGNRIERAAELNPCLPLAAIWGVGAIALPILDWQTLTSGAYCALVYLVAVPLFYVVPLLAGGALGALYRAA